MQWNTQAGNITTNLNIKVDPTLPALSTTNVMTCKSQVDDSAKGRYYMILELNLLTELGLNLNVSDHIIETDDGTFNWSITPIFDLGTYELKN